jgi:hypothetical protein
MAVAECPNCKHDIPTPEFRFFSNKTWKDFHCPYCRAELKKKGDPWPVRILVGIGVAAVPALSHQYAKYAQLLVPFAGVLWGLFSLSRPKLQVVNAPYDPAHDLKLRHSEKQSELFPMREPEAGRVWLRNPSADLNSLRLR